MSPFFVFPGDDVYQFMAPLSGNRPVSRDRDLPIDRCTQASDAQAIRKELAHTGIDVAGRLNAPAVKDDAPFEDRWIEGRPEEASHVQNAIRARLHVGRIGLLACRRCARRQHPKQ